MRADKVRPDVERELRLEAAKAWRSRKVATSMTTVGLIGSGRLGSTVARLAVGAGHDVVLSNSRGPDTLRDLTSELGPLARAGVLAS